MRFILLIIFILPACAWAAVCDRAKLSYLLETAAAQENIYAVQFALDLGANPNGVTEPISIKCFSGMPTASPVMHAASHEDTAILKLLLQSGASPNTGCCDTSALQIAKENKNSEAAKLLKQYGAKN
ncbi:ankyrin repeat domain-containing protein [Pseudoalteromonas sp. R3]|uniref:ankyrin repeat domain-containing protein n=1 Tax=Pseudoalteromonas sp. R3 TaxID=1709477 RepID=UPI0006B5B5D8|nr:ankyrin repeat domain-containing protein [Pseudoalteromonas sp. R3]AZZ98492.1 ankyrin repeat domain-containing protein [Pseudoalteromonas sp. R3]